MIGPDLATDRVGLGGCLPGTAATTSPMAGESYRVILQRESLGH